MLDKATRKAIEKKLGYRFRKRSRLEAALTHPSYRHENEGVKADNQRLEFLGDAALGLAAAADLYERHQDHPEGTLTHRRSLLTNRNTLARIGRALDLGACLRLGRGEELSGGRTRASNLTDAVEAIIGAVYLDGGQKAVDKVYKKLWAAHWPEVDSQYTDNPKGKLQEYCQKKWKASPVYRISEESGPPHARLYTCVAVIRDKEYGAGQALNKRAAEAQAAEATLRQLTESDLSAD